MVYTKIKYWFNKVIVLHVIIDSSFFVCNWKNYNITSLLQWIVVNYICEVSWSLQVHHCTITTIPTLEKEAIESDYDGDGWDREYWGETGHLTIEWQCRGELSGWWGRCSWEPIDMPHLPLLQQLVLKQIHRHCHIMASVPKQPAKKGDVLRKTRLYNATKKEIISYLLSEPHAASSHMLP